MTDWPRAFADRPVFLTGHTGFKGAWLTLWLRRLGAQITGYSLPPPTTPSLFEAAGLRELLVKHHGADVRDYPRLAEALAEARPHFIFHLAAQALVRTSYAAPGETFETNIVGTLNVLEAVRVQRLPCVLVVVTSDKCYENVASMEPHAEGDRLGGSDPYSASKAGAELVCAAYRQSFFRPERVVDHGVRLATVRAGNVIGGGDWAADRIICDIARAFAGGQPIPVRNPLAVRPWQHVLEPLAGYLQLAARLGASDDPRWCTAWNFGPRPESHRTVRELVEEFIAAWGGGNWYDSGGPKQPYEAPTLRLSIEKAQTQLGWQPRWSITEAVHRTADWYRRYYATTAHSADEVRGMCHGDIGAYESDAAALA